MVLVSYLKPEDSTKLLRRQDTPNAMLGSLYQCAEEAMEQAKIPHFLKTSLVYIAKDLIYIPMAV